jgi:hypothetical protein
MTRLQGRLSVYLIEFVVRYGTGFGFYCLDQALGLSIFGAISFYAALVQIWGTMYTFIRQLKYGLHGTWRLVAMSALVTAPIYIAWTSLLWVITPSFHRVRTCAQGVMISTLLIFS